MNTISLCVIAGNEEKIAERFLRSFAPAVDEICLCIATGNQPQDSTADIFATTCAELGKPLVVTKYENQHGPDWPHVDDFAAARNASFQLGTCDWLAWADIDDTLPNTQGFRRAAQDASETTIALVGKYDVPPSGTILRERMIRRNEFKGWSGKIHEHLIIRDESLCAADHRLTVCHSAAPKTKMASPERNLRILRSIETPTGRQLAYIFSESVKIGKIEQAMDAGARAIQSGELDEDLLYDLHRRMGAHFTNDDLRERTIMESIRISPHRAEAMVDMSRLQTRKNAPTKALAWSRLALHQTASARGLLTTPRVAPTDCPCRQSPCREFLSFIRQSDRKKPWRSANFGTKWPRHQN